MPGIIDRLQQEIEKFDGVKTKIGSGTTTFTHRQIFAAILSGRGKVKLEFITPSKINHTRMAEVKQMNGSKFKHTVVIKDEEEIDAQITGWLMIAHATN